MVTKALTFLRCLKKTSSMNVDMPVADLLEALPHRPPMVWVDRISEVGKDYKGLSGTCIVDIDKDALYVSDGKTIRGSSAIEFTAQGFGYLKAAYQVLHNFSDPPSKTYLTGVRSCLSQLDKLDLSNVSQLEIKISVLRELLPITYVKGEVFIPGETESIAQAEIQVFFD